MAEKRAGNAGAGMGASLDEPKHELPGVVRGAITGGGLGAAGGTLVALSAVAMVSNPMGWCIGFGTMLDASVGAVVGPAFK